MCRAPTTFTPPTQSQTFVREPSPSGTSLITLPSTSGAAVSKMMFVFLRDLLPDLQQDINHHLVIHHSHSRGSQALGESMSDKGHRSDPARDRQPSLVDQVSRPDEQLSYVIDPQQLSSSRSRGLQTQKQPVKRCSRVHDALLTSALKKASTSEFPGSHQGRSRVALAPRVKR